MNDTKSKFRTVLWTLVIIAVIGVICYFLYGTGDSGMINEGTMITKILC